MEAGWCGGASGVEGFGSPSRAWNLRLLPILEAAPCGLSQVRFRHRSATPPGICVQLCGGGTCSSPRLPALLHVTGTAA